MSFSEMNSVAASSAPDEAAALLVASRDAGLSFAAEPPPFFDGFRGRLYSQVVDQCEISRHEDLGDKKCASGHLTIKGRHSTPLLSQGSKSGSHC